MSENADSGELSAFVESTLRAIATGIANAQDLKIASAHGSGVSGFTAPRSVEFDIAVSAKKTGTSGAGLKVAVFGIGANAGGEIAGESSTVSRIRFSVPMNFKSTGDGDVEGLISWKPQ
ncbi:trypco2 family protein [Aurantiacibacter poecillastricola]|uniref:trypco2 family protein n=1 Tax=Aurantiacibacter poecillastricola TaxID=3064385 RepID=UPI00273DF653|nr:trypco2 family protein [Aurantiacibacter sp. 219JJ12-13]MDP5262807.1 trypco2 family protein [Aurantiacibacter sp. 219JJ12-13]